MRMIEAPKATRFQRMTKDLALVLILDLEIKEHCPLALILNDEESRTNLECVTQWIWKTFHTEGLEPRWTNRGIYREKLQAILLSRTDDILS